MSIIRNNGDQGNNEGSKDSPKQPPKARKTKDSYMWKWVLGIWLFIFLGNLTLGQRNPGIILSQLLVVGGSGYMVYKLEKQGK
jgi:hypothetical protein